MAVKLSLRDTTRPLRLEYDTTKVVDFGVSSLGALTVTPMAGQPVTVAGALAATSTLTLPQTTGATVGVFYENATPLLHTYHDATSFGENIFVGRGAGNFINGPAGGAQNLGSYNIGIGSSALQGLTTGYMNTVVGVSAMQAAGLTGYWNVAMGESALRANTSGHSNLAIGVSSMQTNTSGHSNIGLGMSALENNTTGHSNAAGGFGTLFSNTTGASNAAWGYSALQANTTGDYNVAMGRGALYSLTSGYANVAVGFEAGIGLVTGNYNTILGANINAASINGLSSNILIGDGAGNVRASYLNAISSWLLSGILSLGSADVTGGVAKSMILGNVAAAPSVNPIGGGILYAEAGALKFRGSSGTVTTLAPA